MNERYAFWQKIIYPQNSHNSASLEKLPLGQDIAGPFCQSGKLPKRESKKNLHMFCKKNVSVIKSDEWRINWCGRGSPYRPLAAHNCKLSLHRGSQLKIKPHVMIAAHICISQHLGLIVSEDAENGYHCKAFSCYLT